MTQNSHPVTDALFTELATVAGLNPLASLQREDTGVTVFATDIPQISRVMRFANEHRLPVRVQGANTSRSEYGADVLVLRMERLNALKEHVWQDMTCTVDAGMPWNSMQAQLKQHGQFVALDPLRPDTATVGGVLATNDSGALRVKYGALRDLVIGVTLVLTDGTIAKSGGKVVKNVAGYDLNKLLIGSFGSLAVIAEVTFRLHSLPRSVETVSIVSANPTSLGKLLLEVSGSQLSLQSMQLRAVSTGFSLDICLSTLPEVLQLQKAELARMAAAHGLSAQEAAHDVWSAREAQFTTAGETGVAVKAAMLPSAIARFADFVRSLGGSSVTQAGGLMTAGFSRITPEAIANFRDELESAGGSLTILQQSSRAAEPMRGTSSRLLPVMQRIKRQFDPNNILDPAGFLEGL
ncbi:MAG TPA: FAD-binding oxidoreductase [Acidobacteriaceae bacterium]|jgi:glycolate oxidase FAD binding subunit